MSCSGSEMIGQLMMMEGAAGQGLPDDAVAGIEVRVYQHRGGDRETNDGLECFGSLHEVLAETYPAASGVILDLSGDMARRLAENVTLG